MCREPGHCFYSCSNSVIYFHILKNFYQYEVDNLAGNSFSLESLLLSKFLRNVDSNYVMLRMECQFFDSDYMHAITKVSYT